MSCSSDISIVNEIADTIKEAGFRVFLAKSGTYGFFTDKEGACIVSFQMGLGGITFSGNYVTDCPQRTGTGWIIKGGFLKEILSAYPPHPPQWAVGGHRWRFTTLDENLEMHGKSSGYEEFGKVKILD